MKVFACSHCHQPVHFDNVGCLRCGHRLGFVADQLRMDAIVESDDLWQAAGDSEARYRLCANEPHVGCNWLIDAGREETLCLACRHNRTIPDLSAAESVEHWRKLELAKRHLFYSLLRWGLANVDPTVSLSQDLVFDFLAEEANGDNEAPVLTGHAAGVITISLSESDDAEREARRRALKETYRTVLGHFRHEVGHYYWDRLVGSGDALEPFRALFGDERTPYAEALEAYYANGPQEGWQGGYISAYASSHPWEDFAETWAHYVHIVDSLETAHSFGLAIEPRIEEATPLQASVEEDPYHAVSLEALIEAWVPLTVAINSINRSMGQPDLYPFVLSDPAIAKLSFVHALVRAAKEPKPAA